MTYLRIATVSQVSNLSQLAAKFSLVGTISSDLEISHLAITAAFCRPGSLFVAVSGAKRHGTDFLAEAIENGAIALLTDRPGTYPLPTLIHPNPRQIAGLMAADIYRSEASKLYGVTGTNGKTSTAFYLQRLLELSGIQAGLISSAEQRIGTDVLPAELTTPEAPRLHQLLADMRAVGQLSCALEISAQALVRNRVDGITLEVAGFTNLSRDHLDDFGDMASYLAAKALMFNAGIARQAVINIEDEWGRQLYQQIEIPKFGIGPGFDYEYQFDGQQLRVFGRQEVTIGFQGGNLMAKNLALAATMLLADGVQIPSGLVLQHEVPGRLQLVSDKKPHVYVDYAHTPAGVLAAVTELSQRYPSLSVVLGASGNRDQGKRAEMAMACQAAQLLVITDQHPRDEDPAEIRRMLISAAMQGGISHIEVPDPAEAIARAIAATGKDGAVLWCGPGHLKYREIAGQKVAFDAIAQAREAQSD